MVSGCATLGPQSQAFLDAAHTIPESKKLISVPFVAQSENYCGPATLTMAMQASGAAVTLDRLGAEIVTPGKGGTLQEDMLGASRRHGRLAVKVDTMAALLGEIAAGNPVIVFQNLGLSWYPRWHYALAVGYDLEREKIILHSGQSEFLFTDLKWFERSWALGSYWALVVLSPDKIPATADDLAIATGAAGLEQVGKLSDAAAVYQKILIKWPHSQAAFIGMGNVRYAQNDFKSSAGYLKRATQLYPESAVLWHNLALAQGGAGQDTAARVSARTALRLVKDADEARRYGASLQGWL